MIFFLGRVGHTHQQNYSLGYGAFTCNTCAEKSDRLHEHRHPVTEVLSAMEWLHTYSLTWLAESLPMSSSIQFYISFTSRGKISPFPTSRMTLNCQAVFELLAQLR